MRTIKRDVATLYVVSADGKILLGKKKPGTGAVYPDCLHNPGGGFDVGETAEEAAKRELFEETGIDEANISLKLIDDKGTDIAERTLAGGERALVEMNFYSYRCDLNLASTDAKVIESDDLVSFAWYPVNGLQDLPLTPPSVELLKRIGTGWLS